MKLDQVTALKEEIWNWRLACVNLILGLPYILSLRFLAIKHDNF